MRYEGTLVVELTVDEHGNTENVFVIRSLGMGLDEAGVEAARHSEFTPSTLHGQTVAARTNLEVAFRINDGNPTSKITQPAQ